MVFISFDKQCKMWHHFSKAACFVMMFNNKICFSCGHGNQFIASDVFFVKYNPVIIIPDDETCPKNRESVTQYDKFASMKHG